MANIAIVFEFVEGETLAARLAKGPLPEDQAVAIAVQLADALSVAHGARVLHRDLKPSNVMLAPGGVVKILDFGIARLQRPDGRGQRRAARGFMGTPGYVAPEQWAGKTVDERADLYALGVVLFEMLDRQAPVPGARAVHAGLRRASTASPAACRRCAPACRPALDKLVARLLAANPGAAPAARPGRGRRAAPAAGAAAAAAGRRRGGVGRGRGRVVARDRRRAVGGCRGRCGSTSATR